MYHCCESPLHTCVSFLWCDGKKVYTNERLDPLRVVYRVGVAHQYGWAKASLRTYQNVVQRYRTNWSVMCLFFVVTKARGHTEGRCNKVVEKQNKWVVLLQVHGRRAGWHDIVQIILGNESYMFATRNFLHRLCKKSPKLQKNRFFCI